MPTPRKPPAPPAPPSRTPRRKAAPARPPQHRAHTALVLQGGGALGAYQAGAYQALAEQGRAPDWVAGISIGAINAALIAGNAPEHRVERLRTFWERVSSSIPAWPLAGEDAALRPVVNDWAAAWGALFGLPGFFRPRAAALPPLHGPADGPVTSFYLTDPLRATLDELVDFDRIHSGDVRLSVGAVDVEQGNFVYFDSRSQRLKPEHVMASGALPPGFPAVTVDGRPYWDGGLVSNTPLAYVVDEMQHGVATIFQIDLFSARGRVPQTLPEAAEREKDIRYSSRTRAVTDMLRARHEQHQRLRALAALLPAAARARPPVRDWLADTCDCSIDLVHLIHRNKGSETQTKDYEFSRPSMVEHWNAGYKDMRHTLAQVAAAGPPPAAGSFRVFDFRRTPSTGARP